MLRISEGYSQAAARAAGHHRAAGLLLFLLLAAVIVGAAVYLAVRLASHRSSPATPLVDSHQPRPSSAVSSGQDPALEQARMRYARGELSREDFTRLVADLGGQPPAP